MNQIVLILVIYPNKMKTLTIKSDAGIQVIDLKKNQESSKHKLVWDNGNTITRDDRTGTLFFNNVEIVTGLKGRVEVDFNSDEKDSTNAFLPSDIAISKSEYGMVLGYNFVYNF